MSTPFIGQITAFAFGVTPKGWAQCNGQLLQISTNQALFSLLGTSFGGNGQSTFGLPDLRGQFSLGLGSGTNVGQRTGEESHTLTVTEIPAHTHTMVASSSQASLPSPSGNFPAVTSSPVYGSSPNTTLGTGSSPAGGGQAHPNQPPFLAVNYCIALVGVFPPRS